MILRSDYLLRAEVIALHTAGGSGGAQFYISCYQITVDGGSGSVPAGVSFPGAHKASDPGILINIHSKVSNYVSIGHKSTCYRRCQCSELTISRSTPALQSFRAEPPSRLARSALGVRRHVMRVRALPARSSLARLLLALVVPAVVPDALNRDTSNVAATATLVVLCAR